MPDFDPFTDVTERIMAWVRIPCLPIEYYDSNFLMRVGKLIREPMKVDQATSLVSRGKFARICVEVDLTKPLLTKFKLRNQIRHIEYKGLYQVCFGLEYMVTRKRIVKKGKTNLMKTNPRII